MNNNEGTLRRTFSKVVATGANHLASIPPLLSKKISNFVQQLPKNAITLRLTVNVPIENAKNLIQNIRIDTARDILLDILPFTKFSDFKTISKRTRCFLTRIDEKYKTDLKHRIYKKEINGVEFFVTASNFNPDSTTSSKFPIPPKTLFKTRIYGYLGDPEDLNTLINTFGKTSYINHHTDNGINTAVTEAGFISLNSNDYLRCTQIPIDNYCTIYLTWYKHPILEDENLLFSTPSDSDLTDLSPESQSTNNNNSENSINNQNNINNTNNFNLNNNNNNNVNINNNTDNSNINNNNNIPETNTNSNKNNKHNSDSNLNNINSQPTPQHSPTPTPSTINTTAPSTEASQGSESTKKKKPKTSKKDKTIEKSPKKNTSISKHFSTPKQSNSKPAKRHLDPSPVEKRSKTNSDDETPTIENSKKRANPSNESNKQQ